MGMSSSHTGSDCRNTSAVSNCPSWLNSSFIELLLDSEQKKRGGMNPSCKTHSRTKLSGHEFLTIPETNEPLKVLLKYTFTCNSMFRKNCIQTRFGGVRLPSTIEQFDETFTDFCNLVVVKKDSRNTIYLIQALTHVNVHYAK